MTDTGLDGGDLDSSVGSVFLPLQRCKRKRVEDPVEVNQGSSSFNVVREVKASDKGATVSGSSNFNVSGGVKVPDKGMNVSGTFRFHNLRFFGFDLFHAWTDKGVNFLPNRLLIFFFSIECTW